MHTPGYAPQAMGAAAAAEPVQLDWHRPERMATLGLWNFLMRIVTLGIHQFWGKAEIRRRLWSGIRLNGEPLTYTGTGWELFRGFLFAILLFFVPFLLVVLGIQLAFGNQPGLVSLILTLTYIPFTILFFVGYYTAQRYRLSRTEWRGIRGSLDPGAWSYAWHCFWTGVLIFFTLGWIWPWRSVFLQRKLVNKMRFGDRPFHFDAPSGPLYGRYAILWVMATLLTVAFFGVLGGLFATSGLSVPQPGQPPSPADQAALLRLLPWVILAYVVWGILIALAGSWYQAFKFNHFARHTSFEGARFSARLTGIGLLWQTISNGLIALLSLGILTPVALARLMGYRMSRTELSGTVPMADILQSGSAASRSGEGLAQLFEIDVF